MDKEIIMVDKIDFFDSIDQNYILGQMTNKTTQDDPSKSMKFSPREEAPRGRQVNNSTLPMSAFANLMASGCADDRTPHGGELSRDTSPRQQKTAYTKSPSGV